MKRKDALTIKPGTDIRFRNADKEFVGSVLRVKDGQIKIHITASRKPRMEPHEFRTRYGLLVRWVSFKTWSS
jgi:hypothetical protein